jgi:hypothetical protein
VAVNLPFDFHAWPIAYEPGLARAGRNKQEARNCIDSVVQILSPLNNQVGRDGYPFLSLSSHIFRSRMMRRPFVTAAQLRRSDETSIGNTPARCSLDSQSALRYREFPQLCGRIARHRPPGSTPSPGSPDGVCRKNQ